MDKIKLIKECLSKQKESLLDAIERAKDARDNAPSAMESHSDTSRSQNEKLVMALEEQLREINRYLNDTEPSLLTYLEVKMDLKVKKFLIVPEGLGGVEIDGVRLLSAGTPLGLLFANKKAGDRFEFNNQELDVLKIE